MRCKQCSATDVWQVVYAADETQFARRVHGKGARVDADAWIAQGHKGFPERLADQPPSLYCAGCYKYRRDAEGPCATIKNDEPKTTKGASGKPIAAEYQLDAAVAQVLKATGDRHGEPFEVSTAREAQFVNLSRVRGLHPDIASLLRSQLYTHQAAAIRAGLAGKSVVIATDTASGKSLCYQTLAGHLLTEDPSATVLYFAPINALLIDQLDAFEKFFTGSDWVPDRAEVEKEAHARSIRVGSAKWTVARYDGAVPREPRELRQSIRKSKPRLLLTNPEMMVHAILPRAHTHKGPNAKAFGKPDEWGYFFRNLKLVIIDELHAYRGVFGAHLANILRRIRRMVSLCKGDVSAVRYFACSATIRDPGETFSAITGIPKPTIIGPEQDGSPKHRRVLVPITTDGEKLETFAARFLPMLAHEAGARTIMFRDNIPGLQQLHARLNRSGGIAGGVEVYNANNPSHEKRDKLQRARDGHVRLLLTTCALELGIDIGHLNASVLLGYPGSIAKTWQMLGRAGRSSDGLLVYVAGGNYLDQYWYENAQELIGNKAEPEDIVVDPDNTYVVAEHLRGAAADHVIDADRDAPFFGPSFDDALEVLENDTEYGLEQDDNDYWILRPGADGRAHQISLRSLGQFKVPVFVGGSDTPFMEEESHRAPKRLFKGAVFLWEGVYYQSQGLSIPAGDKFPSKHDDVRANVVRLSNPTYLTMPRVSETTEILNRLEGNSESGWGQVKVTTRVDGYYRRPDLVREIEGGDSEDKSTYVPFRDNDGPPDRAYTTQGTWFQLDDELTENFEEKAIPNVLLTVGEALVRAVPLLRFASYGDLTSTLSYASDQFTSPAPVLFINETVLGGAGLARRLFERKQEVVDKAIDLLEKCPRCSRPGAESNGCPRCVSLMSGAQDRRGALALLHAWSRELTQGPSPSKKTKRLNAPRALRAFGYTNCEHVASGGFGQVYMAHRDGERVAVKLVLDEVGKRTHKQLTTALRSEAERLKALDHPYVLKFRDFREMEGAVALETEWADGGELDAFVDSGPKKAEAYKVWCKVVSAIAYLHENGIVHRDLKDNNVLFHQGEPKVCDFGIARDFGKKTAVAGTPDWAPPEQESASNGEEKVSPTLDVWTLGKLLAFVFTRNEHASHNWEHHGLPQEVPDVLHPILAKCLAKSPSKRYRDASALLKACPPSLSANRRN